MAKKQRRPPGAGSVDQLPSGKWRVRVRTADGSQVSLGTRATEAEARAVMTEAVRALAATGQGSVGTMTLRAWGPTWLKSREADGIRGHKEEGYVWSRHVLGHAIADVPLRELTRKAVLAWMNDVRATPVMVPSPGGVYVSGDRKVSRRVVLHEVAGQLGGDEPRRRRMADENVDHALAVALAAASRNHLAENALGP